MRRLENGHLYITDPGSIFYGGPYSMRHIGYGPYRLWTRDPFYGPHGIWTPPRSTFYGAGPYSIIAFGPAGSILCREYGPGVHFPRGPHSI